MKLVIIIFLWLSIGTPLQVAKGGQIKPQLIKTERPKLPVLLVRKHQEQVLTQYFVCGSATPDGGLRLYKIVGPKFEVHCVSTLGKGENHIFQCVQNGVVYSSYSIGTGNESYLKAYKFNKDTERLKELSVLPMDHTFIHLDVKGDLLIAAGYGTGSIESFKLDDRGRILNHHQSQLFTGSSIHPRRQKSSHPHSFKFDLKRQFGFAIDLGSDALQAVQFKGNQMIPRHDLRIKIKAGSGPRHFAFHLDGTRAYLLNEMSSTLIAFSYHKGKLTPTSSVSCKPEGYTKNNNCADIHVHPNGKFVYASNRGHNSIAIFKIKGDKLERIKRQDTMGVNPRNFAILNKL
ncbi:MAG: lactonase family protein, partial [Lentisphaeraceae bacterium]|nr:lactonase family protein [Lentisphaeraceae bacterium]